MKNVFGILVVFITINCFSQETGIKFYENLSLNQLFLKADSAKKLVFIDCYATWCGPCKYLTREIFPQKEIGDFYNSNFICAKFDMEKGEGIEIAKKYEVKAFPTLLFLDSKGVINHMRVGSGDKDDILKLAITALDKDSNHIAFKSKIDNGNLDLKIIMKYLQFNPYSAKKDSLLNLYFNTLSNVNKVSEDTWAIIDTYIDDYKNNFFQFLLKNEVEFKKVVDTKDVDYKIYQVFIYYISANSKDSTKTADIKKELKALHHPQVEKAYQYMEFSNLYKQVSRGEITPENWKAFIQGATLYLSNATEVNLFNKVAWFIYENYKKVNDMEALKMAKIWALKSIELEKNAYNLDTYANIVYDLGESTEAIKYEEEAVSFANKNGDSGMAKSLAERLDFFKNNQK